MTTGLKLVDTRRRPIWSILRGDFRRGSGCKSLTINSVGRAPGEESGEEEAEVCTSYVLHITHFLPSRVSNRILRDARADNGRNFVQGWSDPSGLLATSKWEKVGSLQPNTVSCPRPN